MNRYLWIVLATLGILVAPLGMTRPTWAQNEATETNSTLNYGNPYPVGAPAGVEVSGGVTEIPTPGTAPMPSISIPQGYLGLPSLSPTGESSLNTGLSAPAATSMTGTAAPTGTAGGAGAGGGSGSSSGGIYGLIAPSTEGP